MDETSGLGFWSQRAGAPGGPFRRSGLLGRIAPFAVVAVLAEASLALPRPATSVAAVTVSVVLLVLTAAQAMLLPWGRLPEWATTVVPLTYIGSVLALILAAGPNSGVGLVLLIPVVWCALFQRWGESLVVAAAAVAVEAITSVAQHAAPDVTTRRVVLWALLSAVILVAAHRLRERLGEAHQESMRLEARLRQLTVVHDRDRIAAGLNDRVIGRLFAAGVTMQGAAGLGVSPEAGDRIAQAVGEVDEAIALLRSAVFELSSRPHEAGLRQAVLAACQATQPCPEISFSGPVDDALPAESQERLIALLREVLTQLGAAGRVTAVALTGEAGALAVSCEADLPEQAGDTELDRLKATAEHSVITVDSRADASRIRVTWRFETERGGGARARELSAQGECAGTG